MADFSEPEREAEAALDQAHPAAVALALGGERGGKGWETDARVFLRKQAHLLDCRSATSMRSATSSSLI